MKQMNKVAGNNNTSFCVGGNVTISNSFNGNDGSVASCETVACSGVVKTKKVVANPFRNINLNSFANLDFCVSDTTSIEIIADEKIIELIKLDYQNDTLNIGMKGSYNFTTNNPILVKISHPHLDSVSVLGLGDAKISNLKNKTFTAEILGSGDITVNGCTQDCKLSVLGSGDINAKNLKTQKLDIKLLGSGDIVASTNKYLNAAINGSGDIDIYDNPTIRKVNIYGSGDINFL